MRFFRDRQCVGWWVACLLVIGFGPAMAVGVEPASRPVGDGFLHFSHDLNTDAGKLESAIVTFENKDGVKVHLVAAVHVGDKGYYEKLNKIFKGYDSLLYEMVKPRDAGVPQPGQQRPVNAISFLQRTLKNVLNLQFQLDGIDYNAANFVHADLDAETFADMQEQRGESILGLMLQQVIHEMMSDDPNGANSDLKNYEFLAALTSPDRPRQLKLLLAEQFQDLDAKVAGLNGPNGSVLLTERNKAAIRTLKAQLDKGDKEIGIFYGAAHMPDLAKRVEGMGFHRTGTQWLTAWDMPAPPASATTEPGEESKGATENTESKAK